MGLFGFTNDAAVLDAAIAYRDAAEADGWMMRPTYGDAESVLRAATLEREGFKMMILSRDQTGRNYRHKYEASVSLWGPDGLCIEPPDSYDFDRIKAAVMKCGYCKASGVKTERVGFAGRCCSTCLPRVKEKVEYKGWCD